MGEPRQAAGWLRGPQNEAARVCGGDLWQCSVPVETTDVDGNAVDVQALWERWVARRAKRVPEAWECVTPFTKHASMQAIVL